MDAPAVLVVDDGDLELCCRILAEEGEDFAYLSRDRGSQRAFWPTDLLITNQRWALRMPEVAGALEDRPDLRWYCLERGRIQHRRRRLAELGVHVIGDVTRHGTRELDPDLVRLLVLQALFEGADRRNHVRLPCSYAMQVEFAGERREATLLDLSPRGCRFRSSAELPRGAHVQIFLPSELDPNAPSRIYGVVERSAFAPPLDGRAQVGSVAARFQADRNIEPTLEAIFRSLEAGGPVRTLRSPPPRELLLTEPDRRSSARHQYDRHVSVLRGSGQGEPEVLRGHDLSLHGLRLASAPGVGIGSEVVVALHRGAGRRPLRLRAHVKCDHGEAGVGLEFGELAAEDHDALAFLLRELPQLELLYRGQDESDPFVLCSVGS